MDEQQDKQECKPTIRQMIASVLAAFFGVQSSKNKERDFKHGNYRTFIVLGITFTLVFMGCIYMIVQLVLYTAAIS